MPNVMTWDELVAGYWIARRRRLAKTTQDGYRRVFAAFGRFVGDRPVEGLTVADIEAFLDEQQRSGIARRTLSDRWVILSSLWTWAHETLGLPHLLRAVARPAYNERTILPFTESEVRALVRATEWGKPWVGRAGKPTRSRRPHAKRDRAVLLVLLDCGLRASELCGLTVADYQPETGRLLVRHGKGDKERIVFVGDAARQAIWQYRLTLTGRALRPDAPLFPTRNGTPQTRDSLKHLLATVGTNAGVSNVHAHRFRHTFATLFLRNGGNLFELQRLLGHSTLEMVQRYARLSESDLASAQRRASPADRLNL